VTEPTRSLRKRSSVSSHRTAICIQQSVSTINLREISAGFRRRRIIFDAILTRGHHCVAGARRSGALVYLANQGLGLPRVTGSTVGNTTRISRRLVTRVLPTTCGNGQKSPVFLRDDQFASSQKHRELASAAISHTSFSLPREYCTRLRELLVVSRHGFCRPRCCAVSIKKKLLRV